METLEITTNHNTRNNRDLVLYHALVNHCAEAIILIDESGLLQFQNRSVLNITGFRPEETIGRSIFDFVCPEDLEDAKGMFAGLFGQPGVQVQRQYRILHKDGYYFWVEGTITNLIHDPYVKGFVASYKDITKRKEAELTAAELTVELERSVAETYDYKYALDAASIVTIVGADGNIKYVNDNFCKISKFNNEEVIGQNPRIFNSGYHSPEFFKNLWDTVQQGKIWKGEIRNKTKDGGYYWGDTTIVPFLDGGSKPYQYLVIRNDITERKEAEARAVHNEVRMKQAQQIAHVGSWELNFATGIGVWSEESCKIYGLDPGDNKHTFDNWLSFIHPEDMESVMKSIKASNDLLSENSFEHRIVRKDGTVRYIHSISRFEFDSNGKPTGLYGVAQDITERKEAENEIKGLSEHLEERVQQRTADLSEANKALEAFSSTVSHDLRAPVRAVTSFAKIIQKEHGDKMEPEVKELFGYIEESGKRMGAIIDDLLKLAKCSNGQLKLEPVDMTSLVNGIWLNINRTTHHNAKLELAELPVVYVDMSMLQQVVVNLLSNAIKYSSKKEEPVVTVWCEQTDENVTFYFKDNGAGFDMERYDRLFEAFQRLHNARDFEGTGVGLTLVKKIIEKHGGTVGAEGKVGEGATFWFSLPKVEVEKNVA